MDSLNSITQMEDKTSIKKVVQSIFNPVVASAYQVRVGDGPRKDDLLRALTNLVKLMRDLEDIEGLKNQIKEVLSLMKEVEKELNDAGKPTG